MACKRQNCGWCRDYDEFQRLLRGGSKNQLRKYVKWLFDRVMHVELDRDVDDAILDGSWPSAIEQLERGLELAEKIRRENPQLYDLPTVRKYAAVSPKG